MFKIISIHSFRRGTGKSSLVANLAALMATAPMSEGITRTRQRRVCAIDTNIQSPSLPLLFGMDDAKIQYTLNDYLLGRCEIEQAAYSINLSPYARDLCWTRSRSTSTDVHAPAEIILVPASMRTSDITQILRRGYDITLLHKGLQRLVKTLDLDIMIIDTHAGLNEETLPLMALADEVIVLLRLDPLEYQGTAVMIDITQQLEVPNVKLFVNQVPGASTSKTERNADAKADAATVANATEAANAIKIASFMAQVKSQVEQTYEHPVIAVLPASDDIVAFASNRSSYQTGIFVIHYPDHPITATLKQATTELLKEQVA